MRSLFATLIAFPLLSLVPPVLPAVHAKPASTPTGWEAVGEPETYDQRTVFKAINGAAELYISYGFVQLRQRLLKLTGGKLEVALRTYDLGRPINALGVYLRELPEDAKALQGVAPMAAFSEPAHCLAIKGRHYLRVQLRAGQLKPGSCKKILAHAASTLSGKEGLPAQVKLLPTKGRIPGSLGYTRKSFLGLRELTHCLHARYPIPGGFKGPIKSYLRFVLLAPGKGGVGAVWKRLLKKKWTAGSSKSGGLPVLHRLVPYKGAVALVREKKLIRGVAGAGKLKATLKLLKGK